MKLLGRFRSSSDTPGDGGRYGPNSRQVEALLEWLRSLSQDQVTMLAGLYGSANGLLPQSGTSADDVIGQEEAERYAELFKSRMRALTRLPIAAQIDRPDRPAPLAVHAAIAAVGAAIDDTGRMPPETVQQWAPRGGADLALLLVARPDDPVNFDWLWSHYAQDLPDLGRIANA